MTHLPEGTIVALRDGSLVDADAAEHLDACATCQGSLADARQRAELIDDLLGALDEPTDTEAAKAVVRARLDRQRAATGRPLGVVSLRRAAALLLLGAGAAAALPGSPVRGWLFEDGTAPAAVDPGPEAAQAVPAGGIEVNVPDGRIQVVLNGVASGSSIDVVWTESAVARVEAPSGSSYSFGAGRAEATVTEGPIRIELPRFAPTVSVEIDGRAYLSRTSGSLEVFEETEERTADRIRFVVQAR